MDDKDAAYVGGVFALAQLSSSCRFVSADSVLAN